MSPGEQPIASTSKLKDESESGLGHPTAARGGAGRGQEEGNSGGEEGEEEDEEDDEDDNDDEDEGEDGIKNKKQKNKVISVIVDGKIQQLEYSGGRVKRYYCRVQGCGKAYSRPGRLEEHVRSHTGERPFKCPTCRADFGRDSHLRAHVRIHATEDDKPCLCETCGKRFWTNQHLKKHVEVIHNHKGKTYDCIECDEVFRKHHLLKAHVALVHREPGADPFECDAPGCDRTFKQLVHLKAHTKTHDSTSLRPPRRSILQRKKRGRVASRGLDDEGGLGDTDEEDAGEDVDATGHLTRDNAAEILLFLSVTSSLVTPPDSITSTPSSVTLSSRSLRSGTVAPLPGSRYICSHPRCLLLPPADRSFTNWTLLQRHHKQDHPPTCHYPECDGKTFTSARGLRQHLALHDEKERGGEKTRKRMRGRGRKKGKEKAKEGGEGDDDEDEEEDEDDSGDTEMDMETEQEGDEDYSGRDATGASEAEDSFVSDPLASTFGSTPLGLTGKEKKAHKKRLYELSEASKNKMSPAAKPKARPKSKAPQDYPTVLDMITGAGYIPSNLNAPRARRYACPWPGVKVLALPTAAATVAVAAGGGDVGQRSVSAGRPSVAMKQATAGPSGEMAGAESVESGSSVRMEVDSDFEDDEEGDELAQAAATVVVAAQVAQSQAMVVDEPEFEEDEDECEFRFTRVYDVERHLRSSHGFTATGGRDALREWLDARLLRR